MRERQINGAISPEILALITGRELLISHLGCWPTFEDFEVISITLERSPWPNCVDRNLRVIFYIFDISRSPKDAERKQAFAELFFRDIDGVQISGFNHQNPISGMSISESASKTGHPLQVEWGGTCVKHDVTFHCGAISVIRITDLNPFRKPLSE